MNLSTPKYGQMAFLGSGETSLAGGRIFDLLAKQLPHPLRIAIMETPAGFELNSSQVAGRVGDFLGTRLQNHHPLVDIIPARKKGTAFSPDDPDLLAPLLHANFIFMGPGSPTYAVRQLQDSLAWDMIRARHRLGATLVFASAATVAVSQWALPVYEIYKVGLDVHTVPGLDLFASFGMPLSFIPHWNNAEGGADVDTSRCFVGMDRFAEWCGMLPKDHTTVGLDEHTGIIIDFNTKQVNISGVSSVSLLRDCDPLIYPAGVSFPLGELGPFRLPDPPEAGIDTETWRMVRDAPSPAPEPEDLPPAEVLALAEQRQQARARKDWATADELRIHIASLGWTVLDTPEGPKLSR
jgi:hypothetical protein